MTIKWKNSYQHYGTLSISLHWFMLLLLIIVYASIELRELYPKGSDTREAFKTWHFISGLTVFTFVWFRLFIRWSQLKPVIFPEPSAWQQLSARVLQITLYFLMIALPLSGWLILSAEGNSIPFYGFELPALITQNKPLAEEVEEIHEIIATTGYFLIAMHVVAGLFHHYRLKDNTLIRMLPKKQ